MPRVSVDTLVYIIIIRRAAVVEWCVRVKNVGIAHAVSAAAVAAMTTIDIARVVRAFSTKTKID